MRQAAVQERASAVAVCEDVHVSADGLEQTRAIKVLVEHRRGLCVSLYMPFRRKLLGYSFGDMFATSADPEVNAWPDRDVLLRSDDGALS